MQLQIVDESQGTHDVLLVYILGLNNLSSLEKYGVASIECSWPAIH